MLSKHTSYVIFSYLGFIDKIHFRTTSTSQWNGLKIVDLFTIDGSQCDIVFCNKKEKYRKKNYIPGDMYNFKTSTTDYRNKLTENILKQYCDIRQLNLSSN